MSKKIYLTGKHGSIIGNYAIVDDDDYNELNKFNWFAVKNLRKNKDPVYYAKRDSGRISMHRVVINCFDKSKDIDHVNHNGLDNRKENLRSCTRSQNSANSRHRPAPISGCTYKGVQQKPGGKNWRAFITLDYKTEYLGTYNTAEDAAIAYDIKAIEIFGEFACLNFPNNDYKTIQPPCPIKKDLAISGHKYISIIKNMKKKYEVNIYHNTKRYRARFYELDQAIKYRDKTLKYIGKE